jgi:polar amino acid transport system substrate-binding protein
MKTRRSLISFAVALLSMGAIVGCGSSSSSSSSAGSSSSSTSSSASSSATSSSSSAGANSAVAALVPSAIKAKGTLTVAADASYAPNEFIGPDGHTVVGMDADLAKAIAATMGLKATISNVTFDAIIPGLAAGKYDLGASSFTDTKAREKVVNFVDYFSAGESFFTKASGGTSVSTLADLCGKSVAVESTTTEQTDAQTQSKKCKAAGKPAVNVIVFPNQNAANLALSSGRAQLGFVDSPIAAYQVKKSAGAFKLVGPTFAAAPYGLAIPKKSGLDKAVLAAVKALIKDGSYTKILTKWGVQAGAITTPKLNGATS